MLVLSAAVLLIAIEKDTITWNSVPPLLNRKLNHDRDNVHLAENVLGSRNEFSGIDRFVVAEYEHDYEHEHDWLFRHGVTPETPCPLCLCVSNPSTVISNHPLCPETNHVERWSLTSFTSSYSVFRYSRTA